MTDDRFRLSDSEHELHYKKIDKHLFRSPDRAPLTPVLHPRIVITGGQPGSGKTKLIEISEREFPDDNVVVINGDDLRYFHPEHKNILKLDDKRFAELTDSDCREWTRRAFDHAIEMRYNIIFESTMRDHGPISKTMERLRESGYHLTAKVLATHERQSITGISIRYEGQKSTRGYGRFTPLSSHDAGYDGLPRTVEHIEKNRLVDRIQVYNRDGEELIRKDLKNKQWDISASVRDAIEAERERPLSDREINNLRKDWHQIFYFLEERKAPTRDIEEARQIHSERVFQNA